jgi:hypothetical protein
VFFSFLGVFWKVKCFNQKWLHHHQLESYSKERRKIKKEERRKKKIKKICKVLPKIDRFCGLCKKEKIII